MRPRAVRKRYAFRVRADLGAFDVGIEVVLQVMVAGHLVPFAAFFVQAHPRAAALHVHVLDAHFDDGPDAREGIDHETHERPVPQAHRGRGVD